MTITAKYTGTCAVCGNAIRKGDQIEWTKGEPPRHTECPEAVEQTSTASTFTPTDEQRDALALFATGESLAIEAGAGTGKTSTLKLLAESTTRRGQYVAFNKAIVAEAGHKMPETVECNTAHSLAFRAVGHQYRGRLRNSRRMKSIEIANLLGIAPISLAREDGSEKLIGAGFLGGLAMATVTRFCQSADLEITVRHVPYIEGIDSDDSYENNDYIARSILPAARRAWDDLMNPRGALPFRHDHYLKAWHLSGPTIHADYILFDEAQDANPVMQAIVAAQTHAQLVWVGDSQQQIYSFTGAINALAKVPAENRTFLTQSFRFGHAVAEVANEILNRLNADLRLVGTETIPSTVESVDSPDAILTRTNAAAVRSVLQLQTEGRRVALVGGGEEVVRFAKAARDLMNGLRTEHPELACFESWGEVEAYVDEDEQGGELRLMVKLVNDFGVPTILEALDRTMREEDAEVIVSTAHKAKGREWSAVRLAGDFPPPEKMQDEEYRLLYVAVTRARITLDISAVAVLEEVAMR